ncbi:hypothetical protein QZH41_005755 [Actinostola sp. cb2023]|nr:hypothetical protein QZH41_005755 [Actinostola sp. cb2023]
MRRKEMTASKEEEALLKDRIEELMEDLEAEQGTKQELNAQIIEERSSRELKLIELQDLREKIRDEKHINQSLREQVLKVSHNEDEPKALRQELSAVHRELEEERLTTQRHNLILNEAIHKLREQNVVLQRHIEDVRSSTNDNDSIRQIRDESEEEQKEIERIQSLLEDVTSTKKALKYQDLIEELQVNV